MAKQFTVTGNRSKGKPAKPRADFPLYPHAVGKWAKTIRGKTYYFGTWDDPEGALREYLDQRDDLYAGRTPGAKGGLTVKEACNAYMRAKRTAMDLGKLSPRSFVDCDQVCRRLIDQLSGNRSVSSLGPADFNKLHAHLARKHSINTLGRVITVSRSIFLYAFKNDLIEKPVKFGTEFKAPSKADQRKAKAKTERTNGKKLFTADELRWILDVAPMPLKAMILLGINGALGNTDISNMPQSAIDLKNGWLNYPRVKTGIERRIPLWPTTVAALREAIDSRPDPADPADSGLVFLTRWGQPWVRYEVVEEKVRGKKKIKPKFDDAIAKAFGKILDKLEIRRRGLGFYCCRHTFETIGGGSKDQVAVDAIMGHVDASMAAEYRHGVDDARLRAVVEHVSQWLFEKGGKEDE